MSALFIQYTTKKRDMWGGLMKRRTLLGGTIAVAMLGLTSSVGAQQPPIKIGMSMPQTGGLAGGGKASLLGIEIWRDDVNAKGGLLGDKVELLFAPYATVPTAPIMPMVKQRGLLLMGNFSFQVNSKVQHDMWFNNSPWNDASSWSDGFFKAGQSAGAKTVAVLAADNDFAQNLANGARTLAKQGGIQSVYDQNYPPTTTDFSSLIRGIRAA